MTDNNENNDLTVALGYPLGQLTKAFLRAAATATSPDSAAADHRLRQWQQVITGMLSGSLHIGSRTPVGRATAWVTLEVAHGGFATGNLAASGPLQPHELTMLAQLDRPTDGAVRALLNLHFLSDAGRHQLQTLLTDGTFRVRVPEEGALLVAVWLLGQGQTERAAGLIETITPLFDRLRFYPLPEDRPLRADTGVCIQTVGEIVRSLQATRPRQHIERSNEAVQVWAPLSDRAVALFAETVEGDVPTLQRAADETLVRAANGQPIVIGGWPCRHFAADWSARAQVLLDEYASQRPNHPHCAKPDRPKENFARLRGYLQACITDPRTLNGKEVGMIRKIVASVDARRGVVGGERHKHLRSAQLQLAQRPTHAALARLLSQRLEPFPLQEGLTDPQALLGPLTATEQTAIGATQTAVIPITLKNKLMGGWQAPLEVLVHHQLVPSSEAMAKVLPALTARVRAAAIADPDLRRVYEAVYVAFRRRRSLLLLDLSSQVKLGELPWIAAVQPWLGSTTASRDAARTTLTQVAALTLTAFPHTLLPNKLIRECRALAATADLTLPLVEELASDIFMGSFSGQFLQASHAAARLLTGTLYERYYGLAFAQLAAINDLQSDRYERATSAGFALLCAQLAGNSDTDKWSVARNGTLIEQAQILTTHNLAVLFAQLELRQTLDVADLAQRTLVWICRRQQRISVNWRAQMKMMKNTAYAWRQLVFYLALLDRPAVEAFLVSGAQHLAKQPWAFRQQFAPVFGGLQVVVAGEQFDASGLHLPSGGRRFLGWSVGRHWLLPRRVDNRDD